jgi:hypothetical protein
MNVRIRLFAAALAALAGGLSIESAIHAANSEQSAGAPAASERRLVFPAGKPSGLSGAYWTAALANGGPAPRHERLLAVMPDGRVLGVVDGGRDHVMLSVALLRDLSERKLQATLVHNHPTSVSLGESDLLHLAKVGVARVVAVGSDGTVYEAAAGARYDAARFAENLYQTVESRVRERLVTEVRRDREDPAALSMHVNHLVAIVLDRARVIDYVIIPSETARLAFDRYRELFERVALAEGQRLEQDLTEKR